MPARVSLKETLEAATPGPWAKTDGWMAVGQRVLGAHQSMTGANIASTWGENGHNNAALLALAPELAAWGLDVFERHAHLLDDDLLNRWQEITGGE